MPLFNYKCDNPQCTYVEEILCSYKDKNTIDSLKLKSMCPECGTGRLVMGVTKYSFTPGFWGDTGRGLL